jgi:hypothetical protein
MDEFIPPIFVVEFIVVAFGLLPRSLNYLLVQPEHELTDPILTGQLQLFLHTRHVPLKAHVPNHIKQTAFDSVLAVEI